MAYLTFLEAQESTAVFTYGRNNPPTIGHEKLFDKTMETAKKHGTQAHIFTSHSQDNKKNPLSGEHKVKLIKHAYPEAHVASSSKEMPSLLHIAKHLHEQGHKHLVMVAGSDRVKEYKEKLNQYNGTHDKAMYNFKSIKVVSAGHRDPDAEGAAGMSGTKLRSHAIAGNKEKFKSGLMSKLSDEHKNDVYHHVRKALGVNEVYDPHLKVSEYQWGEKKGTDHMKNMTPGETPSTVVNDKNKTEKIREQYVAGEIYKIGQLVEMENGARGTISYRGSNYVTVSLSENKQVKCWLDSIKEVKQGIGFSTLRTSIREQKLPVLLMNAEQRKQLHEQKAQLEFDGIQTKHFDVCPKAYVQFKKMIETIRAGKHIGEITGHEQPTTTNTDVQKTVEAGIALKPAHIRQMQFKQYTGI